ncbi:hypothetical protein [Phenylobacterium sp.]|uniref:hypothetical protein n=1 Tax=Phenylobacterium sp. TaxID=1871053 RepID=UPI0035B009E4
MVQGLRWWRRLGAALAAFALVLVALGPSLDALVCRDDAGAAAAAHQEIGQVGDADDAAPAGGGLDACVHGHCHHGGGHAPPRLADAEGPGLSAGRPGGFARQRVPTSDPQYGLMRPPRA